MNRIIVTIVLVVVFCSSAFSQLEALRIDTSRLQAVDYLKVDDFYLTHYLHIDLFLREGLYPQATPAEVAAILAALRRYVSVENSLDVAIHKSDSIDYLIRFAIYEPKDGAEMLIAFTNWSVEDQKFGQSIEPKDNPYMRWYYLNSNKMTYRKDMSTGKDYSVMGKPDLANAYLFDELPGNDSKIESIIDTILSDANLDPYERIMVNLIQLKYLMLKGADGEVDSQTATLSELLEQAEPNPRLKSLEVAFEATKFQAELMK